MIHVTVIRELVDEVLPVLRVEENERYTGMFTCRSSGPMDRKNKTGVWNIFHSVENIRWIAARREGYPDVSFCLR